MFRFRSFQGRLVFFFLGLVSLVQIAVFLTVDITNTRHARNQIGIALDDGVRGFRRLIEARTEQLTESVRILAGDFAFKTAIATGDVPTIGSVLENHGSRVGADVMLLVSLDHALIADSRGGRQSAAKPLPRPVLDLVRIAEEKEQAAAAVALDGAPYQLLVLPVLAPNPVAWIAAGFDVDDRLARDLRQFTQLETSFASRRSDGQARIFASSLPAAERGALAEAAARGMPQQEGMVSMSVAGEEYLSRVVPLGGVDVVLQRSLAKELKPFQELRVAVLLLSCGGLLLSAFGAFFIARSVTRPVLELAAVARGAEKGDYATMVQLKQQDELGVLAGAFNRMLRGLAERDRVRSLLGKVVSPAIAEKLLSREVELGGEEREVTVLFSDLRNFTASSEKRPAQETVSLLNAYFTRMGAVIEDHHGVVDKYIGDGIMALFGAPVSYGDDAGNAVCAALAMVQALEALNVELASRGMPRLDMGIGVNTAVVVAGNLGSPNRLNYTVIGDGVNLASRLEGLTKRPGSDARIIISEFTLQRAQRRFRVRALGPSSVRGKAEPIDAYAVLGFEEEDPSKRIPQS